MLLSLLAVLFVVCSLSVGLLISTLARSQAEAQQLTIFTVLPSILLSGYISPVETLPGALYVLSRCLPITHFLQITRGIMVRGAGLGDLVAPILSLMLITTLLLTVASLRFRKTIN